MFLYLYLYCSNSPVEPQKVLPLMVVDSTLEPMPFAGRGRRLEGSGGGGGVCRDSQAPQLSWCMVGPSTSSDCVSVLKVLSAKVLCDSQFPDVQCLMASSCPCLSSLHCLISSAAAICWLHSTLPSCLGGTVAKSGYAYTLHADRLFCCGQCLVPYSQYCLVRTICCSS